MTKYHVETKASGVNFYTQTVDHISVDIFRDGIKAGHSDQYSKRPAGFKSAGNEASGFDQDAYLLSSNNNKVSFIDADGMFVTITLFDQDPVHKQELFSLDNNPNYGSLCEQAALNAALHGHAEFDFYI